MKLKSCNNGLEATIIETRKHCYAAEEKARKKSQDLTIAKRALIDNNAHIDNLERQNSELHMRLGDTVGKLDKKHKELIESNIKRVEDFSAAEKFWIVYRELGADLFYRMTYLELIAANGCGKFFFEEQDLELKARATKHLPLNEACKTMQVDLTNFFMEKTANNDLPENKETVDGGLRLPIEASPAIDETGETLAVDESFADTSKDFKEDIVTRSGEDRLFFDSTEFEHNETSSKTREVAPIFTAQVEAPPPAATTPPLHAPSVDIASGDPSQAFKAGEKERMTRAQRREAFMKAQAEAMASKQNVDSRAGDEEGRSHVNRPNRQKRRAAKRKAKEAALKQSK